MKELARDTLHEAYAAGRKKGAALMAGCIGSTRRYDTPGKPYYDRAEEIARAVGLTAAEVVGRVSAFHAERLDAAPDLTVYPEMRGERERLQAFYRGMTDAGVSEALVALSESLHFWQMYRFPREFGKSVYRAAADQAVRERCRVVYMPDSDRGPLHMKNVDDPLNTWTPHPPVAQPGPCPWPPLFMDGVGNGLHVDEIPPEIFPADARELCARHCATVAEAEEFLSRYNYFWGGANLLIHDDAGNSVAIDKASRCRYAVRRPGPDGINYVNGMSSFDEEHEAFIEAQRRAYLADSGHDENGTDAAYWRICEGVLRNIRRYMNELRAEPTLTKLLAVMTARDADGPLCKDGSPTHPDEPLREATLQQCLCFLREKVLWRRQWRGALPVWEDEWEVVRYE